MLRKTLEFVAVYPGWRLLQVRGFLPSLAAGTTDGDIRALLACNLRPRARNLIYMLDDKNTRREII